VSALVGERREQAAVGRIDQPLAHLHVEPEKDQQRLQRIRRQRAGPRHVVVEPGQVQIGVAHDQRVSHRVLAVEVVEERALGDAHLLGDAVDRRRCVAVREDQFLRRDEDPLAGPLARAGFCRFGHAQLLYTVQSVEYRISASIARNFILLENK
jgi:hypothetical protein